MTSPDMLDSFGPLTVGRHLCGRWIVGSIDVGRGRARVVVTRDSEQAVLFVQSAGPQGPFGVGGVLSYQPGDTPLTEYLAAGEQIASILRDGAQPGRSLEQSVSAWLTASRPTRGSWRARARRRLVGRPDRSLPLTQLLSSHPSAPCLLPWHRLEMNVRGVVGPCCSDYQAAPWQPGKPMSISDCWDSEQMRAFRRALASGDPHQTCSVACPHLAGGSCGASDVVLRGGTAAQVDAQLARAEAMAGGAERVGAGPASVQFAPTSFCNYDCLMCDCGQTGTLDDELDDAFYEDLLRHAGDLQSVEVCGGEPLASPRFRRFLKSLPSGPLKHLSLGMTTNGSYLTEVIMDALGAIRRCSLIISLNAATDETYQVVNRGLSYARVRKQLDALLSRKAQGTFEGSIRYSMVILRANVHEIEDFAALCRSDGVGCRFMLPQLNLNDQSIMLHPDVMASALDGLERVLRADRAEHGEAGWFRLVEGEARILRDRLDRQIIATLPDARPPA